MSSFNKKTLITDNSDYPDSEFEPNPHRFPVNSSREISVEQNQEIHQHLTKEIRRDLKK